MKQLDSHQIAAFHHRIEQHGRRRRGAVDEHLLMAPEMGNDFGGTDGPLFASRENAS